MHLERLITLFRRNSLPCLLTIIGVTTLTYTWVFYKINGVPSPFFHDEFAYLLAGETYARGALSMPTHPLWQYFETYHILQTPSYAAKYPPAQSLFIAVGFLLGNPLFGVWLSIILLAMASAWMLLPYDNPRLAFIIGIAVGIWFGGECYWAQSFWGGAGTALGAVLLWGGVIRFSKQIQLQATLAMGAGVGLLFLSRPFDGFLACIIPFIIVIQSLGKSLRAKTLGKAFSFLAIGALPLVAAFSFQALVNRAVTGNPWRMPYTEYQEQYDIHPVFLWEPTREYVDFRHPRMEKFDMEVQEATTHLKNPVHKIWSEKIWSGLFFQLSLIGSAIIAAAFFLGKRPFYYLACAAVAFSLLSTCLVFPFYYHYIAATTAPLLFILFVSLESITSTEVYKKNKSQTVFIGIILLIISLMLRGVGMTPNIPIKEHGEYRKAILEDLEAKGGNHLVVVRYEPPVPSHVEYVFNGANIDNQQIIWARWMENGSNKPLFDYFKDRKFWILMVSGKGRPTLRQFEWREDTSVIKN